jgi:hypothetical protein
VLTWQGTAIARDPIKETDPEIAVGDGVDHQAEVVVPNRKDVPIVNLAVILTVILIVDLTVDLTVGVVDMIAEVTVELAVNRKRASNAYFVTDRTA